MSLPASLLLHVEQHGCFTGCYGSDANVSACLSANQPLQPLVVVTCLDCLGKLGVPLSLLPAGMNTYNLAQRLTDHQQDRRARRQREQRLGSAEEEPGLERHGDLVLQALSATGSR